MYEASYTHICEFSDAYFSSAIIVHSVAKNKSQSEWLIGEYTVKKNFWCLFFCYCDTS